MDEAHIKKMTKEITKILPLVITDIRNSLDLVEVNISHWGDGDDCQTHTRTNPINDVEDMGEPLRFLHEMVNLLNHYHVLLAHDRDIPPLMRLLMTGQIAHSELTFARYKEGCKGFDRAPAEDWLERIFGKKDDKDKPSD